MTAISGNRQANSFKHPVINPVVLNFLPPATLANCCSVNKDAANIAKAIFENKLDFKMAADKTKKIVQEYDAAWQSFNANRRAGILWGISTVLCGSTAIVIALSDQSVILKTVELAILVSSTMAFSFSSMENFNKYKNRDTYLSGFQNKRKLALNV